MANYPFQRLQSELSEIIGNLPAESRLPSEPALAQQLGVSRATLRDAMRSFEVRGLIRRRQGVGTFVAAQIPVIDSGLELLESIETLARKINLSVTMGELTIKLEESNQYASEKLNLSPESRIACISRVISTNDSPIAFLVDRLPEDILSMTELDTEFTGSILDLLLKHENHHLSTARTEIRAIGATPEIAHALQIQRDDILLQFESQLFNNEGRIVDYSLSFFLPGYFRFHVVRRVCQ